MKNEIRGKLIGIRLTKNEFTFVNNASIAYAEGNLSSWIRHCLMNYEPKIIKKASRKRPQKSMEI